MLQVRCPYCNRYFCDSDGTTVRVWCRACKTLVTVRLDVLRREKGMDAVTV